MANLGGIGVLAPGAISVIYGGVISGVVLDSTLSPIARVVRASHRKSGIPSGSAVSEPVYGTYTLYTSIAFGKEPHTVIEYDDPDGESFNARIFDNVIPL